MPRRITASWRSDIGNHHPVNQDAGGAWLGKRGEDDVALLVVADGVSAGEHSEEASKLAVEVVRESVAGSLTNPEVPFIDVATALVDGIVEANRQIAQRPHRSINSADSTTIVAAISNGNEVAGAWVGDSRVYLVRGDRVRRLTTDHSWAEGVVSSGLMSPEQAASDPRAHMIMRWLGPPSDKELGLETFGGKLEPGDIVLCCTDGLYMYFAPPAGSEDEIAETIRDHADDLPTAINVLIEAALKRGGYDNVTAAAFRVTEADS
jgi:serine/threonine protein phosphatase PrpC